MAPDLSGRHGPMLREMDRDITNDTSFVPFNETGAGAVIDWPVDCSVLGTVSYAGTLWAGRF